MDAETPRMGQGFDHQLHNEERGLLPLEAL
jgi:hypothetical protein